MKVLVKGAGVAGLAVAHELARRAATVAVVDTRRRMEETASWVAGGMLAPCCESETAGEAVLELGRGAADWWETMLPGSVTRRGTLVVSPARDSGELDRFAGRARGAGRLGKAALAALEPDLASRFGRALFFESEAHVDPRQLLPRLERALTRMGVALQRPTEAGGAGFDVVVDCTGPARIGCDPALRGVRGEVLLLRSSEIRLSRPVRLLHPRFPLYVVPRGGGCFLVGATMIETGRAGPITARSTMELLNAAYALDPAFGEAEIVEAGVGIRPAYPDNLPRVREARRDRSASTASTATASCLRRLAHGAAGVLEMDPRRRSMKVIVNGEAARGRGGARSPS